MKLEQKNQIEHYLLMAVKRCTEFDEQNDIALKAYWKGQVYGVIKMIHVLELNIDDIYWLNQLP